MKELKRFKLTQLSNEQLKAQEMNLVKGGFGESDCCGCGYGTENRNANSSYGYGHSAGSNKECWHWIYTGSGGSNGWDGAHINQC